MAITTDRMVTYNDRLLAINSCGYFDHPLLEDHVTNKNYYTSTAMVPIANKLGSGMVTYLEGLLTIKSFNTLIMWSCKVACQTKTNISTTIVHMATKTGRMVIYLERLFTVKSYETWISWFSKVT